MSGLGLRHWQEVIEVLRTIIPIYDRVNKTISFGKDIRLRQYGICGHIFPGELILDAGSGYGNMSKEVLKELKGEVSLILYDPIPDMLNNVKMFIRPHLPACLQSGIFEFMPFRDNTFDVVMCGYSLRDAIKLNQAVTEIHRVLKQNGRAIIVDIGKPDNAIIRLGVSFYLKYVLGIFAFVVSGKPALKFRTIYGTYLKWPKNSDLEKILTTEFSKVEFIKYMMGSAIIVIGYK